MRFWWCGVVVINNTERHSTKPELKFSIDSNPACSKSEVCNEDNLWQCPTGNYT